MRTSSSLMHRIPLAVYKGAVSSENGDFRFDNLEANQYLLKVSFVGFQDAYENH